MTLERGTRRGSDGSTEAGWRCRQAAWRHASSQKRRRPCGVKLLPHIAHRRVIARPLSLRDGLFGMPAPLTLALRKCAFEAERVRAGLDDVGAVGDPSNTALHNRAFGMTCVHSENGRLVVNNTADRSARSAIT